MNYSRKLSGILILLSLFSSVASAIDLKPSMASLELQKLKFSSSLYALDSADEFSSSGGEFKALAEPPREQFKRKSPTKAFLLSFLVPGAGQFYNGSKLKGAAFLGLEIAAWVFNRQLDADGADIEAMFEQFSRDHWSRDRYASYITVVYPNSGGSDAGLTGVHHLPNTNTQQYYEMTGKYDQFGWGWEDAVLGGDSLDLLILEGRLVLVNSGVPGTIPYSSYRNQYEQWRYDSNQKYKAARRMATVAMVNHLISGLEAFFAARKHNKRVDKLSNDFASISVKAQLRSLRTKRDTPFLQFSYKF